MTRLVKTPSQPRRWPLAAVAAALAIVATAPSWAADRPAATTDRPSTVYGEALPLGNGTARTYVVTDDGVPTEVGVVLGEAALEGLPDAHHHGGVVVHGHTTFETVLSMPDGHGTPFRHVLLNWNPGGHEPPGIYDLAHLDVHFYTITDEERLAIDPSDPLYQQKAGRTPPPERVPEGYVLPEPLAFARMGVHWVDPSSPELNGETFTHTFIYGSWDGRLIFAEPMVTKAFLESKESVMAPLPSAHDYEAPGLHPTAYTIRWDDEAREYRIALTGLVPRD